MLLDIDTQNLGEVGPTPFFEIVVKSSDPVVSGGSFPATHPHKKSR